MPHILQCGLFRAYKCDIRKFKEKKRNENKKKQGEMCFRGCLREEIFFFGFALKRKLNNFEEWTEKIGIFKKLNFKINKKAYL